MASELARPLRRDWPAKSRSLADSFDMSLSRHSASPDAPTGAHRRWLRLRDYTPFPVQCPHFIQRVACRTEALAITVGTQPNRCATHDGWLTDRLPSPQSNSSAFS